MCVIAVSIAKRLQDPLAELVKIEPRHIGVGMYQVKHSKLNSLFYTSDWTNLHHRMHLEHY